MDLSVSFLMIKHTSLHQLLDCTHPQTSHALCSHWWLSEKYLNDQYKEAVMNRNNEILNEGHFFGIVVDGWEMINKVHIQGMMVNAGVKTFMLSIFKEGSSHHALVIAKTWEEDMLESKTLMPFADQVKYFVSDDAGQCARARRILSLCHPHIMFHQCWAHQVNLTVDQLIKTHCWKHPSPFSNVHFENTTNNGSTSSCS